MEITGTQLLIPAVVSTLVAVFRQVSARLDGPSAYWASIVLNVVAQLVAGEQGSVVAGAALGLGTGAVVGPGLATSVKRIGLGNVVKPRRE